MYGMEFYFVIVINMFFLRFAIRHFNSATMKVRKTKVYFTLPLSVNSYALLEVNICVNDLAMAKMNFNHCHCQWCFCFYFSSIEDLVRLNVLFFPSFHFVIVSTLQDCVWVDNSSTMNETKANTQTT